MVLERWTQDRSVLHVRILRSAPHAQLPAFGDLPVLPPLPLPGSDAGLPPVTALPPALQAMLGVAAEAAAAEALNSDTTLPPLPTLSLLPNLQPLAQREPPPPQREQQQPPQSPQPGQPPAQSPQPLQPTAAGSPAPAATTGGAPSAATSSRMGASGGNSASNQQSEPTPPPTAAEVDVPMQQPPSDDAAGA